jgi:hypothetical protein
VITVSNTAGVVTLDASGSTLTLTNRLRIADSGATSTVVWAGGTLSVATGASPALQIGTSGSNNVGTLIVTNGTVVGGGSISLGTAVDSVGRLVVSGPGVFTNAIEQVANNNWAFRLRSAGSRLIITNSGKYFWPGETRAQSNSLILVSGTGSSLVSTGAGTSALTIGDLPGPGSLLIISNGAKAIVNNGTVSIGRNNGSSNTGIVVGAGSQLIVTDTGNGAGITIGVGSAAHRDNDLLVYDGGYVYLDGAFFNISGTGTNCSFHMGGTGAMSTGFAITVRANSQAVSPLMVVTNAVFSCSVLGQQGVSNNVLTVLSKGTLTFSNQYAASATTTNVLNGNGKVTIDGGTISAVTGTNAIMVRIGVNNGVPGSLLTITNGGKLLSELGIIGSSSSYNTGIVTGVGSVWSNYTAMAGNELSVGGGTTANNSFNFLAVQNGATLVNNGSLQIGDSSFSTLNSVLFGGPGAPAVIINSGMVNVGGSPGTSGNSLTISNASLTCDALNVGGAGTNRVNNTATFSGGTVSANSVRVRESNTLTFAAGTLSAGSMDIDPGANGSNVFVVGDGASAAYYDMAAGGSGYHGFSNGGLVVTNGAFLRGNGTLTGTIVVRGTFVPGFANSVGSIFTSNSLSFGGAAVLEYDLGTSSDFVTVNGNLGLGSSILNVTDSGGFAAGTYVLFQHTNTVTAPSGTLTVGALPSGFTATVSNDLDNAQVLLVVASAGGGDPYTAWATSYGLTGGNALGGADPDGDGISNTNEFLAGFNPTNSAAYPHIISVVRSGNDMNITYLGASGDSTWSPGIASRTNVLEFTTGTANGSYSNNFTSSGQTNILSGGTGLGTVASFIETNGAAGATRYYRVRVLAP